MTEQQLDKDRALKSNIPDKDKKEVDLLDIYRRIIAIRKSLYKAVIVGVVIGIIVTFSIPKRYTVEVTLSPEMGSSKGNTGLTGLAASFLGGGSVIGESSDALNAFLSADIVSSTPFLLELFDIEVLASREDSIMTLRTYLDTQSNPWWDYIIGFPSQVIGGVKSLFVNDKIEEKKSLGQNIIELSDDESRKIAVLRKNIEASVDKKTFITNISVTLQNPKVAAVVADSVIHKLQKYIIAYRTSKAKEDCVYLAILFKERQDEYYMAQKKYADYIDTHDNLILQSVRAEQERLQNDMNLAYQVYSQVANQLQVARAKVQEEKPVFAVVEPAVIPMKPSGMGMRVYIFIYMFLAVFCTAGWLLLGEGIWRSLKRKN